MVQGQKLQIACEVLSQIQSSTEVLGLLYSQDRGDRNKEGKGQREESSLFFLRLNAARVNIVLQPFAISSNGIILRKSIICQNGNEAQMKKIRGGELI